MVDGIIGIVGVGVRHHRAATYTNHHTATIPAL
jgi:hypothetical protein